MQEQGENPGHKARIEIQKVEPWQIANDFMGRDVVTLEEYMNPLKFPMTFQKGLSPAKQLRLDAFNYDQLEEAIARGHQMDEEQVKIRAELQAKRPWMEELSRQITAQEKAAREKKGKSS